MLIDWFTVGAQALNFLVLVWLLKRFLYKPILNAIDAREKLIAGKLADADAKEAEAKQQREAFQRKNDAFDKQRAALMTKATDEADAEGRKRLADSTRAADATSARRREALLSDAHSLNQVLRTRTQQEVFAIARRTLTDLAGAGLEDRMAEVFIQRLRTLDGKARQTFAAALETASGPALVRSAFDMPEKPRAAIQAAVDEVFGTKAPIRFETAPDLVAGVEITAHGRKLAWSISNYLTSLGTGVEALLEENEKLKPKPKPAPKAKATAARSRPKAKPKPKVEAKAKAKAAPS